MILKAISPADHLTSPRICISRIFLHLSVPKTVEQSHPLRSQQPKSDHLYPKSKKSHLQNSPPPGIVPQSLAFASNAYLWPIVKPTEKPGQLRVKCKINRNWPHAEGNHKKIPLPLVGTLLLFIRVGQTPALDSVQRLNETNQDRRGSENPAAGARLQSLSAREG